MSAAERGKLMALKQEKKIAYLQRNRVRASFQYDRWTKYLAMTKSPSMNGSGVRANNSENKQLFHLRRCRWHAEGKGHAGISFGNK